MRCRRVSSRSPIVRARLAWATGDLVSRKPKTNKTHDQTPLVKAVGDYIPLKPVVKRTWAESKDPCKRNEAVKY